MEGEGFGHREGRDSVLGKDLEGKAGEGKRACRL